MFAATRICCSVATLMHEFATCSALSLRPEASPGVNLGLCGNASVV
jgi:hypothetical protein